MEIPSESRECWGKFMRVKVRIDILKPLKRWLRLKIGKFDNVTMVGLKYEWLPELCFACGRVGHGIKECSDEEARKIALEGSPTKLLEVSKNSRGSPKRSGSSPVSTKNKQSARKSKSPSKNLTSPKCSPRKGNYEPLILHVVETQACKRKMVFKLPEEDNRENKKGKVSDVKSEMVI
ncbi:hypothetical protein EZV62_024456 [Acer yangbiense]|uniref:CCHC-type domain-containing protein n=1 Tax=Acer yangbiense TaxID=1000413 RepID=A0A5C7GVC8_9ROSI|nr:hypothetical protein EZV62_024456 [Acer yangbiense]